MTQAFISGITGFIGRPLAHALVRSGYTVSGLARTGGRLEGCSVIAGDILRPDGYGEAARAAEVVVHLAAPTVASYIASHPLETMVVNVAGVLNMLDLFAGGAGRHFVLLSSGKVYGGRAPLPFREDQPLEPAGPLGQAKAAAEEMVRFFARNTGKRFTILRLFNGYGPGQNGDFLIPTILRQLEGGSITLGDTAGKRDFIYLDDIVSGITTVLAQEAAQMNPGVYNLGSGRSYSPADLVRLLEEIAGRKLRIVTDPARLRAGEPDEERADISRLRALGWQPATDIGAGLAKTWRAFLNAARTT